MIAGWAVQTGLTVGLLVGLVLLIRRPFASLFGAEASYWLWLLPAIRLFLPTIAILPPTQPSETVAPLLQNSLEASPISSPGITTTAAHADPVNWTLILVSLWLVIGIMWFAWNLLRHYKFRRSVLSNSTADTRLIPLSEEISREIGLRKAPPIYSAADETGPLVMGVWNKVIILPRNFDSSFTPSQQRHVLLHELMHIRRADILIAHLVLAFRALNWPNPLIHIAAPAFRADQEAACDAAVIRYDTDAADYAGTLLKAARYSEPKSESALNLALTESSPSQPTSLEIDK